MSLEEIKEATLADPTLQETANRVRNGLCYNPCPDGVDASALASLKQVSPELTVLPDNDLLLRDKRIIIPQNLTGPYNSPSSGRSFGDS